ncbi:MAG: serine/threonine protein kinase [Labilithrix sp.]|nr:serine/threonine protein kinase [Labilithrix sp.]
MYPQIFGKYVLERELSRGGMARVVLATLRGAGGFEKKLVVKQIRDELSFDQQFVRRFVEEAKTTVALSHPNIVPVYELGVEQGTYFLAMELVEGCSIAELVREKNLDGTKRVLSPEEGAYVGMEVCRALDYAHRRMKVVHRDITPRNVMLDEEGQVKLIDFGIAAPARVAGHEILGSPGHMPPEQIDGKELGPSTDIFAVAVLLMEAWSGIAPFRRGTPEECDEAMRGPHPRPSDYDPRLIPLDDVIVRAMKLDPKQRQQDAADVARALRAFLQGTDVTDIARELGHRVRETREAASDPMPMSVDGGPRAPNQSAGDLGTKTFAAREEAIRWSSPPASEIEPPGASTRRLRESIPPASEVPLGETPVVLGETPVSITSTSTIEDATPVSIGASNDGRNDPTVRRRAMQRDPAMSIPTPLMVEPVGAGSEMIRSARAAQDAAVASHESKHPPRAARGERVDTIATRPLETAVRGGDNVRAERATPRSRTWSLVAIGALVAVGGGVAWRAKTSSARIDGIPPATATTIASTGTSTPTVTTVSSTTVSPRATTTGVATARTSVGSASPGIAPVGTGQSAPQTSASSERATEKAGRALVSFLGDPGTRVSIDGASRGSCPVRVSLEPGQHDVRFQFDPTGESRGERFSVKAGDKVTVRAEFTGATPTVRIQR